MSHDYMKSLLESGKYSDATIVCKDKEFQVHKAVICPQSPVIAAALDGNFTEASTNIINMDNFDLGSVTAMLGFLYGVKNKSLVEFVKLEPLPNLPPQEDGDERFEALIEPTVVLRQLHVKTLVRINGIGDYYKIAGLCECSRAEIMTHVGRICGPFTGDLFMDAVNFTKAYTGDKELHWMLTEVAVEHNEGIHEYCCDLNALTSLDNFAERFIMGTASRLKGLKNSIRKSTSNMAAVKSGIDQCSAKMKSTSECSRCDASYNCYFETKDYKTYLVRCKDCSSRTPA